MPTSERILGAVVRAMPWARWMPGHSWGWTWADLGASLGEAWPLHVRREGPPPQHAAPSVVPGQRTARVRDDVRQDRFA